MQTNLIDKNENKVLDDKTIFGQFLTFNLGNEEYGIDILSVMEIRGWEEPTPIPSAPHCIKGVINLRGNIIPVVDLRTRFNLPEIPHGPATVLIVIQINLKDETKTIGIVVDAVCDVYTVLNSQVQAKPDIFSVSSQEFLSSLVTIKQDNDKDKLVIVLEPNSLFNIKELEQLSGPGGSFNE